MKVNLKELCILRINSIVILRVNTRYNSRVNVRVRLRVNSRFNLRVNLEVNLNALCTLKINPRLNSVEDWSEDDSRGYKRSRHALTWIRQEEPTCTNKDTGYHDYDKAARRLSTILLVKRGQEA